MYRLTGATNPGNTESYTYDPVGNRFTSADVQGDWTYNQNNELTGYDDVSYEYDNNGNIISMMDQTGTTTYTYDVYNRLVQLVTPNSQLVTYYYDPFGRRLWKDAEGVKINFFYSDEGLVGEYDSSGNETKAYGYAPNSTWTTNPLFQKIGTKYYWCQNDHAGTPQKMIDSSGAVVWSATYDVFGKANVTVATVENNLRFPGQYYDQETGLHYNWNRNYDSKRGRYLTPDPIGLEGGINLFVYAQNNPVRYMDPYGLKPGLCCTACCLFAGSDTVAKLDTAGIDHTSGPSAKTGGHALRHCLAACQSAKDCGIKCAQDFWDSRENPKYAGSRMDLANNQVGYGLASGGSCWDGCVQAWQNGQLDCMGKPCPPPPPGLGSPPIPMP